MGRKFKIGSINGTPINATLAWVGVFIVVTLNFGSMDMIYTMSHLLPVDKQLTVPTNPIVSLLFGFAAAALVYGSILLHEIGHSEIARRNGVNVESIKLFLFGGKAEMENLPDTPMKALKIAAAGPLVSIALIAGLLLLTIATYNSTSPTTFAMITVLIFMNAIITVFNLVPAYPLDGGRILRSILQMKYSEEKAHRRTLETTKTAGFCIAVLSIQFMEPIGLVFSGFLYAASEYNTAIEESTLNV